ncbi:MAG TPA: thiol reductant ABC exporter subunit CydD [Bellilinea sp.]|nr:thiol reductant ABC exporter subunit CydD [Bellilinea sp.]
MNFDRDLLQAARREWRLLALTILLGAAGGIAVILQARQLSSILAAVFIGGQSRDTVAWMFTPLLAILAGRALVSWGADAAAGHLAVTVKENLRSLLVNHLFRLGPAYTRSENSGELTNTAIQGVETLDAYFSQYLPQVVLAGLVPLIILVAVFPVDWLSGLILVLTAPLIPIFMVLIGKAAEAATRRQWSGLSRLSAYFLDTLQGLHELKLLGQSQRQVERVAQASEQYRLTTMTVLRVTFLSALVLEIVGTISTAVIAVQIGLRLLYGGIIFEQAFFILLLAPEFYQPLRLLGLRFHAGANGIQAARRIFTILNTPGLPEPSDFAQTSVEKVPAPSLIRFEHVTYTYPGQTRPAVAEINFQLQRGQMTALVGSTGAGKSTVANLLMRFSLPTEGQILVDGISLNSISSTSWHRRVAWVPQQPVIFQKSIAENIALGNPNAQLQEIQAAARLALLHERILSLPAGYDTVLGEGGARLSGGEMQRLALARAFLLDAPLLVLDEPTAHLDLTQEELLQASVQRLCAGRTVLVIAHRLPTVFHADQILVLVHGSIVESGSHQSLSTANGVYARLLQVYRGVQV